MAARSLCDASQPPSPTTTQHSVPGDSLDLPGRVHLPLRHERSFSSGHVRSPRLASSGATETKINPKRSAASEGKAWGQRRKAL
jgi:hypothetical protein